MNNASFLININECGKFLKNLGILKKENYINIKRASNKKYSEAFMNATRKDSYYDIYRCAMENDDYDFFLLDGSFFQFSLDIEDGLENIRMAFYPSICIIQYEQFLREELELSEEEVGAEYIELYEQYIIEQKPCDVTPLRYDFNKKIYTEIVHSSAHIHLGYEENIRIPVNKMIRPVFFAKLVVEYYYYELWRQKIKNGDKDVFYEKTDFEDIGKEFFSVEDEKIPFINVIRR